VVGRKVLTAVDEKAGRAALVAERHRTFNVKDYGAVADGVADCRAAIHAARDAAGVGGRVFFPKGRYKVVAVGSGADYKYQAGGLWANVEGQTWLLDQAEIVLAGSSTIENLVTVSAPNVTIIGGTLDLSAVPADPVNKEKRNHGIGVFSGTTTTNGVVFGPHGSGAAGTVIDGVTIKDAPGYGIYVLNTNSVTVTGCTLKDFFHSGIFVQNQYAGSDTNIHDFLIHGNRLESKWASFAFGIYVGADQAGENYDAGKKRVNRARVTGNSVVLPREIYPGQGSFFDGGAEGGAIIMVGSEDSVIDGNSTEGSVFGVSSAYLRRVVISNNVCRGFRLAGVEVSAGLESVSVTGNVIDADGAGGPFDSTTGQPDPNGTLRPVINGILSSGGTGSYSGGRAFKDYTITGNTITGFTTPAEANGVLLFNTAGSTVDKGFTNVTISGNTIDGTGGTNEFSGVYSSAASNTNLTITGNTIEGANRDVSRGVTFFGNTTNTGVSMTGNNFANLTRAVFETSVPSAGAFTDFHFRGNLVRNCFTALRGNIELITRFYHDVGLVKDINGNTTAEFAATANAVNYLQMRNNVTGGDVAVRAMGTDANVSLNMWPKGTGVVKANSVQVETKGHVHTVAQVTGALSWTATVPGQPSAAGTQGQVTADSGFLYVCVTSGAAGAAVWKRLAFELWV
jgi:hypothetical protein